jgi:hypothetical protein
MSFVDQGILILIIVVIFVAAICFAIYLAALYYERHLQHYRAQIEVAAVRRLEGSTVV